MTATATRIEGADLNRILRALEAQEIELEKVTKLNQQAQKIIVMAMARKN